MKTGFPQSHRIYLGPLRGVTLRIFRNALCRHFQGVDIAISPFIPTVNSSNVKPSLLRDVDLGLEQSMPVIPQIIGNRPDDVVNMCRNLMAAGHNEINWNLGCPHRPVTRKQRGSGLLPHPDMIKAVLDRVFAVEGLTFSLKVRLGLNDPDELLNIAEALDCYPLSEIIIHPRTGAQMYDGAVDIDRFEQCMPKFSCPLVYNGDIRTADDFKKLQSRFSSIDRWMIGRGLIANPFLAEEIRGITCETPMRQERLSAFLDELLEEYSEELSGPAHILGRMKELWKYLALSVEGGDRLLRDIRRATSVEEYRGIARRLWKG